jgi:hypothetical protein
LLWLCSAVKNGNESNETNEKTSVLSFQQQEVILSALLHDCGHLIGMEAGDDIGMGNQSIIFVECM